MFGIQVRMEASFLTDGYRFYLREKSATGFSYAQPVVMKNVPLGDHTEPFITLPEDVTQELFQNMWNLGFRPKKNESALGELKATKYHLEDLRATNEYLLRKTDEFIKLVTKPWTE